MVYAAGFLRSRNDLTFLEGSMVNRVVSWLRGAALFPDIQEAPFVCSAYGPLFYGLWGITAKAVGGSVIGGYLAGRILALLAWIGTVLAAYSLARRLGASRLWALVVLPAALCFDYSWPAVGPGGFATPFEILGSRFSCGAR